MRSLSLRTRLLLAFGAVAGIVIVAAGVVTLLTRSYLVNQLDDRLDAFGGHRMVGDGGIAPSQPDDSINDAGPGPVDDDDHSGERPSDVLVGVVFADGTFDVYFAPNVGEMTEDIPQFDPTTLPSAGVTYLTVPSESGGSEFRVRAERVDEFVYVTAMSTESVTDAVARLVLIQAIAIVAVLATLSVAAAWVFRLGLTPMRRMVEASERIAGGDLSGRLEAPGSAREATVLAGSLNSMIDRLTASLAAREASEERLRAFVADASHELRTPLTTMLGYLQLHRRGALGDAAAVDDAMQRMEAETQRMRRLVEDLLQLAKFDALPEVPHEPVLLAPVCAEVVADMAAAFGAKRVKLGAKSAKATVLGDADRLRQAVINVVANALEHGGADATVTVRVASQGDDAVVTVEDNGVGMPPELAERATERFVRGDASRSRLSGGAGLGLSITAAIVEAHRGTVTIRPRRGGGTSVELRLPRA